MFLNTVHTRSVNSSPPPHSWEAAIKRNDFQNMLCGASENFAPGLRPVPSKGPRPLRPRFHPLPSLAPQRSLNIRQSDRGVIRVHILTPSPLWLYVPGEVQGLCSQPWWARVCITDTWQTAHLSHAVPAVQFWRWQRDLEQPALHLCAKIRSPFSRQFTAHKSVLGLAPKGEGLTLGPMLRTNAYQGSSPFPP